MVPFGELDDILKGVAGEDLVSTLAADDYFEIARRALRELVKGNDECISDRPVHVPNDFGKKVKVLRSALDFMMIGAEEPGRLGGIVRFVNGRVEADGVGIHLGARLRHERDKQRGVHTGAEISADWNVTAHCEPHRIPQHRLGLVKQFGCGKIFPLKDRHFPILLDRHPAVLSKQERVRRWQRENAFEHRARLGDVA